MQSSKEPIPYKISKSVGSTLHNNLLFITHTSLLIGDGDDLRVQDNHLISNSLWLLLEIEKAATSKIEK